MRLPGLGPKTAARIWKELGISTLEELKPAAEDEQLRALPGLGAKSEEKILKALAFQAENPDAGRRLLGVGLPAVQAVVATLRGHPAAVHVSEAGSVRRRKETFRDLDIIATATDPGRADRVLHAASVGDRGRRTRRHEGDGSSPTTACASTCASCRRSRTGTCCSISPARRITTSRCAKTPCAAGYRSPSTASRRSRPARCSRAKTKTRSTSSSATSRSRRSCARTSGELEAARRGELPELVELSDVRGDLHTHTDWSSDGKNSLEEMVAAALARGYEYYAITDHSHYLRDGRLAAQLEEIEQLRERYPKLRILAGVEANIRSNGEVDVPEEELARLDWVVASVHNAPENRPTERVLEAMQNPYVDCIGHLTGRRISTRGPRDVDVERVIEKCARGGLLPRDQRAAGPARPARRARARREGGGPEAARQLRRASDRRAELRRVRDRPGAARLADEGRRREHTQRGRSSTSCAGSVRASFRDDGHLGRGLGGELSRAPG